MRMLIAVAGLLTLGLLQAGCVFSPVADDTFIFCPPELEVTARRELNFGRVTELSEEDFLTTLNRQFISYRRVEIDELEICEYELGPDIMTVYEVQFVNHLRRWGWSANLVTIDNNGMVKHIEGEFWVFTH